jgi:hypothetical protein
MGATLEVKDFNLYQIDDDVDDGEDEGILLQTESLQAMTPDVLTTPMLDKTINVNKLAIEDIKKNMTVNTKYNSN